MKNFKEKLIYVGLCLFIAIASIYLITPYCTSIGDMFHFAVASTGLYCLIGIITDVVKWIESNGKK